MTSHNYALGATNEAQQRLAIQDAQFGPVSEQLLDAIDLRPNDRVVELGIGPGSFGCRIMQRLGSEGVLVGVDYTESLLEQAKHNVADAGVARFEPVLADIQRFGDWITEADVVVGRTVVHHLPMAEVWLGRLLNALKPGTRVGFVEPEFRVLLTRIAALEQDRREEMEPLRIWAEGISRYYTMRDLSPGIGATMALAMRTAGYRDVNYWWAETPMSEAIIANTLLYYDEIRDNYISLGIMTGDEIDRQKEQLAALPVDRLPAVWGTHCVTCVV